MDYFKIYHIESKIRLGVNADGGYVIADNIGNYDCYISAGVSTEESFSRDFIIKYQMNKYNSYAFDGTINNYPYNYTKNITFIKKNISDILNDQYANLSFLMNRYNDIFLKMDIESCEYKWLLSLSNDNLNKFKQIVIEFHGINDDSWNCELNNKIICFNKLSYTHYPVHVHGNNYGTTTNNIPDTIEVTYIRKDIINDPVLNKITFPIPNLDFPNDSTKLDYVLCDTPFVTPI
jgi:hypothetical protein